jgi:hypothetical protein
VQTLPRHSLLSKCYIISHYTCKCNFIYTHKICMAFPAVIFMKLQMFNSIMCKTVKLRPNTHIWKVWTKINLCIKLSMAFILPIFMKLSHSVHVCGHVLYQTLSKSDKKCERYGQNFSHTSMTVTELILFKVTLPWQIFVGLVYQILWKGFNCLDVWPPSSLRRLLNGMLLWTHTECFSCTKAGNFFSSWQSLSSYGCCYVQFVS